ncbi:MAG: PIN domain-containing protein [Euryarchaeota archaeon]|nr:PIN domain-containing protein [Euryarchaeota archaeon]
MKCLDTTFLIDLLRNDENALEKAKELDETGRTVTTEINVFELVYGIYRSKRLDQGLRLSQAERLFSRLTVFPLDHAAALKAGEILGKLAREGKEVSTLDGLTAAIALTRGCSIVISRNIEHFSSIPGVQVETY